ncbi:MAG TPA: tetratricopeptide repeat protein [Candidatus Omnitrophota bacterium]|nr:tetratricopeptide repeat protein [Candidatus Omnitrophota bacterium]
MKKIERFFGRILLVGGFWILGISAVRAETLPFREIKVGVAVTPEFKTNPEWKSQFERRLAYASKIFETEFKIRFRVLTYWLWNPRESQREMSYLIDDLQNSFPLKDADVVIGLTKLDPELLPDGEVKDFDSLGIARPFSGYAVIRYPEIPLFRVQEETVLAHELGHLFGAVHTARPETIMSPIVLRQIPTHFDPDNHRIISLTRDVDFRQGTDVLSVSMVQKLLSAYLKFSADNQQFDFYYALGAFYFRLGKFEDALRTWRAASGLDDANFRVHYDMGMLCSKMGDYDGAISELTRALPRFRLPADREAKTLALNALGNAYFRKGDYSGAYHAWTGALTLAPSNKDIQSNLANIEMMQGKVGDAIENYEEVLKTGKKDSTLLTNLAYGYFQKGEYDKVVQCLTEALKLIPEERRRGIVTTGTNTQPAEIYKNLGLAYLGLQNFGEAARNFEIACQMRPSPECYQKLGEIYFHQGDWDKCVRVLGDVIQDKKKDSGLCGILGICLANRGDTEKALFVFSEGLKNSSSPKTQAFFHRNLGNLYLNQGESDSAAREFRFSIDKDWNNAEGHFGLALAYLAQKKVDEARQSLRTVLSISPSHARAREILAKLEGA